MKNKVVIISLVLALFLVLLFIAVRFAINDACVIRVNNYDKVMSCKANDLKCLMWERTLETGSPGHTEQPNPDEVVAVSLNGACSVKYNCSKCDILKEKFADYCPANMEGTSGWICRMYTECNCE